MAGSLSSSLPSDVAFAADSLAMPSAFRRAHCMAADGQLTPPESPDAPVKPTLRNGPRLQLPRLLRRKTDQDQPHLAVRRSSPVRPYVNEMKVPFPLRLPDSPVASDRSSFSSTSPVSAPELRRRSPTYHDLRSLAARQKEVFAARTEAPLLPSPIEKDDMVQSDSYFTFNNPRRRPVEYRSYQDLHILSCYEEREKAKEVARNVIASSDVDQWKSFHPPSPGNSVSSISTVDAPRTPEEQIYRISTLPSDESDWLANETSCTERKQKFKTRYFQVMQQPSTDANKDDDVTVVRIAGPGKPKLVEISRPSSMSTMATSRRTSTVARPQTPTRTMEVSAFSPYDTPYTPIDHETPVEATPLRPRLHVTVPVDKHRFSTSSLVPAPLARRSTPSTPSDHSSDTAFSSTQEKLAQLSYHYGSISPESHRTICTESLLNSSTATISTSAWPIPPRNVLRRVQHNRSPAISHPPPTSDSSGTQRVPSMAGRLTALDTRLRRLRHTLSSVTAAINGFPDNILRLDSGALAPIRNSQITDSTYTEALGKIFPHARPILLSALAAWLIIDMWFEKTILASPEAARNAPLTSYDVLQSNHGIDFWNAGSSPGGYHYSDGESSSNATTPSTNSEPGEFDHFAAWDAAEHSNSALKRIPTKARSLLGISHASLLDEGMLRTREAALIRRMRVVRPSANIVGQRLVIALRGEWDEDVWRCLRVMVEVIEGSPGFGLGSPIYGEFDAPGPAIATFEHTPYGTGPNPGGRGLGINT